jgi:ATP-binding cassette subfamily C protein
MVSPVQQLMNLVITLQSVRPAMDRLNTLLSMEHEPHYPHKYDPFVHAVSTSVELKNIDFSYNADTSILRNISLHASCGEKIALIGPSGGGKTTLAHLMVGFYPPKSGQILYGDVPIEQIGLPVVRENVALMLQQSLFFNDTIRMNLTLGKSIPEDEIIDALKSAQMDRFVLGLTDGLDTLIGKNGIRLSGGQRQRLSIARLILSNPKIVIFDEATSALDNDTEHRLYETLEPFLKGRTVIIIAHRTTTIKQADRIYLIEAGEIRAQGTYWELLRAGKIREDFDKGLE